MLERATRAEASRASPFGDWTRAEMDGVRLSERRGLAITELAAFGRGDTAQEALSQTLRMALPAAGASSEAGGIAALSIGPGRWLLIGSEADLSRVPLPAEDEAALTGLSGGRAILSLAGPNAVRTLIKGTAVNLAPMIFVQGSVAATGLARMPAVIWRRDEAYDVIVPRSYAVSLRDWLLAAGGAFPSASPRP